MKKETERQADSARQRKGRGEETQRETKTERSIDRARGGDRDRQAGRERDQDMGWEESSIINKSSFLWKTKPFTYHLTHLVTRRIFHRLASGSIISNLVSLPLSNIFGPTHHRTH